MMSELLARVFVVAVVSSASVTPWEQANAAPESLRTWTSRDGKYRVSANLVAVKHGWVKLRKPDGSSITAQLSKLGEADQVFAVQWVFTTRDQAQPQRAPSKRLPNEKFVSVAVCAAPTQKRRTTENGSSREDREFSVLVRNPTEAPKVADADSRVDERNDVHLAQKTESRSAKEPRMSRAEISRYWAAKRKVVEAQRRRQYAIRTAQTAYIMAATRPRPISYLLPAYYPKSRSSKISSKSPCRSKSSTKSRITVKAASKSKTKTVSTSRKTRAPSRSVRPPAPRVVAPKVKLTFPTRPRTVAPKPKCHCCH